MNIKGGNKWILRVKMKKYQGWIRMNFKGENEWMNIKGEYEWMNIKGEYEWIGITSAIMVPVLSAFIVIITR